MQRGGRKHHSSQQQSRISALITSALPGKLQNPAAAHMIQLNRITVAEFSNKPECEKRAASHLECLRCVCVTVVTLTTPLTFSLRGPLL